MFQIDELELEQCVRQTKWSSHHSIVSPLEGIANKLLLAMEIANEMQRQTKWSSHHSIVSPPWRHSQQIVACHGNC